MKSRLAFLLVLLLVVPAVLADAPDPRLDRARDAFADRDYDRGVRLYRELLEANSSGDVAEESAMMIVRGLSLAGDHEAAAAAGTDFLARFPGSRYLDKVAFLTARSLLRRGSGERAWREMSAAVRRLEGPAARARIAAFYLKAGDRAFAGSEPEGPFDAGTPPDYTRALRMYGHARDAGIPAKLKPGVLLRMARAAVETKGFDLAIDVLDELASLSPEDDPSAGALILRGRALLGKGARTAAEDVLERLVALHPRANEAPEALLLLDDPAHLERLVREYPGHPDAPKASRRAGELLAADGRVDLALAAFERTMDRFPASPQAQTAALAAADALFAAERYEEAQSRYDAFLRRWPESPSWAHARELLTRSWYQRGRRHLDAGRTDSAAEIWAALRATYPLSELCPRTLAAEAEHREGEKALALWRELVARYPKSPEAPDAALAIALLHADREGGVANAVAALKRVLTDYPGTSGAARADRLLTTMRQESLTIDLPAPRGTDEAPALSLATRNLEKLSGRAWRIDPVAYFRKHGSLAGIENVMVDVVAPDVTFTHEIDGYEDFREIRGSLEVPVDGAGSWIVVVEGGKLRATGLLLVSGLTVITKESPAGVLAFVQRADGGEPVSGAEILVRDGDGKVRRASTDDEGCAEIAFENGGGVTVLARDGGSVAWTGYHSVSRRRSGLESKVHVSTDRSLYRPGDTVRYRLIARRSAGERHETPVGAPFTVLVKDEAGNTLEKKSGLLGEFGTADGEFAVPADAPPGTYEIRVGFDERTFDGKAVVEAYRKPQVFLGVETDRPVYVRGEEVKFAVTARYAFGMPMPDLQVAVRAIWIVASGKSNLLSEVVRTNAAGRAEFAIPTTPGPDMSILVQAEAVDATGRIYVTDAAIHVPATAYAASLEVSRDRAFPGEELRLTLKTTDRLGNPVAAEGRIDVARGKSEKDVADESRIPVTVGEDGVAEIAWTPEKPGFYRLRYVGTDRRGNEVTAAVRLQVLDAEGRLVVRTDRGRYRVGEEATVEIGGGRGRFALLTAEGEEVYSRRVVKLEEDRTKVALPVTPALYPDARIRVALLDGGELRQGEARIETDQEIRVEVVPGEEEYGPGESARISIRTTDLAGRPVPAEVSVAVVDEGIFRLRGDDTPDLVATFRPPARGDLVRTAASVTFSAKGVTARLSEDLLAERDRRARKEVAKADVLLEEKSLDKKSKDSAFDGPDTNAAIGIGGGAGGAFGGRGGRRSLRASGGGMRAEGLTEPRSDFRDTAFWSASVATGEDGVAIIHFELPDDLTEWRVTARAASRGNAFGEGRGSFRTTRPLVIRAALPRFVREGDQVVAAAGIVNGTGEELLADVRLRPAEDGDVREKLTLPADREVAVAWPLGRALLGKVTYRARVGTTTLAEDEEVRTLETIPFGVAYRAGYAGDSRDPGERILVLPEDHVPGTVRLTLTAAPSLMRAALDGIDELREFPYGCTEQTVNRFYPALEAARAIRELGLDDGRALPELDRIAKAGALRLTYLQNREGLWGWWKKGPSNAEMTAYALIGLARAKASGIEFSMDTLVRAGNALPGLIGKTRDPDTRAFLHYAASLAFGVDFERLAPAYADRQRLGPAGLAWLALAYEPAGRTSQGADLGRLLADRVSSGAAVPTETLGWVVAALAAETDRATTARDLATELVRRRQGRSFGSTRETGAAVVALSRVAAVSGSATRATELRVTVNGTRTDPVLLGDGPLAGRTVNLPANLLAPGENRISVVGSGGVVHYALTLRCVRRQAPEGAAPVRLSRELTLVPEPDPFGLRTRRKIVKQGTEAKEVPVSVVRTGEVVRFTLRVTLDSPQKYFVVEEPLFAGFEPIPGSEFGPYDEVVRHDDRIVFFLSGDPGEIELGFLARSESPGRVRIPAGTAYAMYRPEMAAYSRPAGLTVVARGVEISRDPTIGLSAHDLLDRARDADVRTESALATTMIEALLTRYELTDPAKVEALRLLSRIRMAVGDARGAVDAMVRLRAEVPGAGRGLEDELHLAFAWSALDRFGDACSALESATAILFSRDRRVPEEIGRDEVPEFLPALLDAYPFAPYAESAWLERVNRAAAAREAAIAAGREPEDAVGARGREFLARYPESAAAPEVAFRFARLHLRAGRYEELEREARRFSDRYPDDPLRADADWFVVFSLFAQGRYDEADAAAQSALEAEYRLPDGAKGETGYRSNLIHLRAQVAHVKGRLDEALALYRQVEGVSTDAREAIRLLTEETFDVADVTRVAPGDKAEVEVSGKNVDGFRLELYPVDILVYFVLAKDVSNVAGLNLDGLEPAATREGRLGGERREAGTRVDLGVLDPGVYLVIGRVEDREERGIVIVSDLEARIHAHAAGVRVVVTDRETGDPVPAAYVKIASAGEIVGEGRTDPRGYFELPGDHGRPLSAVAKKDGRAALAEE